MTGFSRVYPDGEEWRCATCGYTTDDDGPDRCPNDDSPLTRTLVRYVAPASDEPYDGPVRGSGRRLR